MRRHAGTTDLARSVEMHYEAANRRLDWLEQQAAIAAIGPVMTWIEHATLATNPVISVIMPTRNRCGLLPRAIASVFAQTYPDLELVVIDDGSSDGTAELLESISDRRLRPLRIDHFGVGAARNAGLRAATGELIAYLDDDNLMHPGWLKSVAWAFEQRPEDQVAYGAIGIDDVNRAEEGVPAAMPQALMNPFDRERLGEDNLADISAIAHREGLPEARFDEGLVTMADWDLLGRLCAERDPLVPAGDRLPVHDRRARQAHRRADRGRRHGDGSRAGPGRSQRPVSDGGVAPKPDARGPWSRRLIAAGPPIDLDDWSLDPATLEFVLAEVAGGRRRIVECGSGASTILIARLLRDRGHGTVHALEHDADWAALTRRRIAAERLEGRARVIEAPLQPDSLAQPGCEWYAGYALDQLPKAGVDLLLVDGPPASPGSGRERSRYPALPRLAGRLAPGAKVILDDAGRAGERWIQERWRRELGVSLERDRGVAATAVALAHLGRLTRPPRTTSSGSAGSPRSTRSANGSSRRRLRARRWSP